MSKVRVYKAIDYTRVKKKLPKVQLLLEAAERELATLRKQVPQGNPVGDSLRKGMRSLNEVLWAISEADRNLPKR